MVDRNAFNDRLQKHGFPCARGCNDERSLAVADWRNQVDCSTRELGSALGGFACFELQFSLGIRGNERAEIGTTRCFGWIDAVDLLDVDYYDTIAVVVACRRENLVAATEHVLSHDLWRHIRISGLRKIAVRCATNEPTFALRIVPAGGFAVGHDRSDWSALLWLAARSALLLWLALSAASTLVASASSVVTVAIAGMTLLLISLAMIGMSAHLLIVLLLLLLSAARAVGDGWSWSGSRSGIGS
jgi:hypothetical protein